MGNIVSAQNRFNKQVITDHGLNLEGVTEEEFWSYGEALGNFERGMQWAIGDWYNGIPWGDKQAACEKVGLNYRSAEDYGRVAAVFQITARAGISFKHHKVLAISDLTQTQRRNLLKQAAIGEDGKTWSSKRLTEERDKVLGTYEEPIEIDSGDAIHAFVEQKLPNLPSKYQKQVERAVKEASHRLADDFESHVAKEVKLRLDEQRKQLKDLKAKAQKQFDSAVKMQRGAAGFMTEKEFKQIRGLLHPDKHPGEEAKYRKAFNIFIRMGESFAT